MFKILKSYLEAGVKPELPDDVKRKLRLSNGMSLIFIVVSLRLMLMGDLAITAFHIFSISMFVVATFFSLRGWHRFSRLWLMFWFTFEIWAVFSFTAKRPDDFVSINGYILLACCTCIPFIFFDFTEKRYMLVAFVPILAGMTTRSLFIGSGYPFVSDAFYDMINRWEETRNMSFSLAIGLSLCFGYLQNINAKSQKDVSVLVEKIETQKRLLSEKEATLEKQKSELNAVAEANRKASEELEKQNRELDELRKELDRIGAELEVRRKEMEETRRLEDCLNEFSAVIRDNFLKSPAVFYDQNLRKLVEFLNAAQGVIFVAVRDYEGVKLKAVAAYAFHSDVKMIKTVTPGDGLVGQAYKSARAFYFDRMPVNTFEIKSALAAIQPFATVVQPLIDNAQVRGVIQLALTRPLEDWERAFLERYSGQLAAAIAGIQAKTLEQAA